MNSQSAVRDVALILDNGIRIGVAVRPADEVRHDGILEWQIVMEVDPDLVMPNVVKIEGIIPVGHCISVPAGPGYDTPEWGHRIFANSPDLIQYDEGGYGAEGSVTR